MWTLILDRFGTDMSRVAKGQPIYFFSNGPNNSVTPPERRISRRTILGTCQLLQRPPSSKFSCIRSWTIIMPLSGPVRVLLSDWTRGNMDSLEEDHQQQLILKWHFQETCLSRNLCALYESDVFTDCTLSVGFQSVKAHRVVLASCSPYFFQLFKELNTNQHPIIVLPNTSIEDVKAILSFVYRGQCIVTRAQLISLLTISRTLRIQGLCDMKIPDEDSMSYTSDDSKENLHSFLKQELKNGFNDFLDTESCKLLKKDSGTFLQNGIHKLNREIFRRNNHNKKDKYNSLDGANNFLKIETGNLLRNEISKRKSIDRDTALEGQSLEDLSKTNYIFDQNSLNQDAFSRQEASSTQENFLKEDALLKQDALLNQEALLKNDFLKQKALLKDTSLEQDASLKDDSLKQDTLTKLNTLLKQEQVSDQETDQDASSNVDSLFKMDTINDTSSKLDTNEDPASKQDSALEHDTFSKHNFTKSSIGDSSPIDNSVKQDGSTKDDVLLSLLKQEDLSKHLKDGMLNQNNHPLASKQNLSIECLFPKMLSQKDICLIKDMFPNKDFLTKDMLTKEMLVKEMLAKGMFTQEMLTREMLTKDLYLKDMLTKDTHAKDMLTKDILTKDMLMKDIFSKEILSKEFLTKEIFTEGILTQEMIPNDLFTKDILTKDLLSKDILTKDLLTKDILTKDLLSKDILSKSILTKDLFHKDLLHKDLLSKDLLQKDLLTKDMLNKSFFANKHPTSITDSMLFKNDPKNKTSIAHNEEKDEINRNYINNTKLKLNSKESARDKIKIPVPKKITRDIAETCKCFICGKYLSNQYNLRVHMETHDEVYHACQSCPHVSRSRDALRKHVSYRHPEEYNSRKRKKTENT